MKKNKNFLSKEIMSKYSKKIVDPSKYKIIETSLLNNDIPTISSEDYKKLTKEEKLSYKGYITLPYILVDSLNEEQLKEFELEKEKYKATYITRDEYSKLHKRCPKCLNNKLLISLMGVLEIVGEDYCDKINTAECKCGWIGVVDELVK